MGKLTEKKCIPCQGRTPPLKSKKIEELLKELGGKWQVDEEKYLEKEYKFANFKEAPLFTNLVGALAEIEGASPRYLP